MGSGRVKRSGKEEELAEALYGHVRESLLGGLRVEGFLRRLAVGVGCEGQVSCVQGSGLDPKGSGRTGKRCVYMWSRERRSLKEVALAMVGGWTGELPG